MPDSSTQQNEFYEQLASTYHLMFADWDVSMHYQGKLISNFLPSPEEVGPVLDCACGIGTQTLPLAALGYKMEGVDLSISEVERAKKEATIRGLSIDFRQDDMRQLTTASLQHYGAVIAMDNALPHLESEEEILAALKAMKDRLKEGGHLLLSLRDYDRLMKERPNFTPPNFFQDGKYRRIVHQIWDWQDERNYVLHLYITYETSKGWTSHHFIGRYRAIGVHEVVSLMKSVGFIDIQMFIPEETGFYQPIIQGTNSLRSHL